MLKVVVLAAALSACAHPRRTIAGGAGMIALGVLASAANSTTYCSDPQSYNCLGPQIGDGVTNGVAHAAGGVLIVGGMIAVLGGLAGLSNEHPAATQPKARTCSVPSC